MAAPFEETAEEIRRWQDTGLVLPLWWRDDDAAEPTAALDRLLALAARFGAPLHLAVVPEPATLQLAGRLRQTSDVFVLTHGWQHRNHAPAGEKKAEFGANRSVAAMLDDIDRGRARLLELFGDRCLPVFTPPWNRTAPEVISRLPSMQFSCLSTFTARRGKFAAPGLLQVNTHLDPIAWKAGGGLLDAKLLDEQLAEQLHRRRSCEADNAEPYGILTHHLVHDENIWSFTQNLLEMLGASGVALWTSPLHETAGVAGPA